MFPKIIVVTTLLFLLVSFSVLFVLEAKNGDPDFNKVWNVVYFLHPRDNSLDFAIENHQGGKATYHYKISSKGKKAIEGEIEAEGGAKKEFSPVLGTDQTKKDDMIEIDVSVNETEYKIYKKIQ